MSINGTVAQRSPNGALFVGDATSAASTYWNNGTPMLIGALAIDTTAVNASDTYEGGLRYATVTGRLKADAVGAITIYNDGLPQTTAGALCVATAAPASWTTSGIPLAATGRVAISTTAPLIVNGFSNGFDAGFGGP